MATKVFKSPKQSIPNQVSYDFYNVEQSIDVNRKAIETLRLTETATQEQLLGRKKSYTDEIARIDAKIALIKALP